MVTHSLLAAPLSPWATLPKAARLLLVATKHDAAEWLRGLFESDRAMAVTIDVAIGAAAGLATLRSQAYDAVLVRHVPDDLDAIQFIEAHRAQAADDPLVVLGDCPEHSFAPHCYEVGADGYLPIRTASPRQLIWVIGRAIEWRRLLRENRRLAERDRQRLKLEHREAERLLAQQRTFVGDLHDIPAHADATAAFDLAPAADGPLELPSALVDRYRELLRAYVIMGSGNLAAETAALVDALHARGLPAPRVMQFHVCALEETLRGLGGRSSRHVMARADLLVLEVMVQLAERFRKQASLAVSRS
ncbi:MAG TPA: hypothetical protein VNH11_34075 [Pirellulales bacterium]|nr:hypothetical protein [Pirellulales bacterium]